MSEHGADSVQIIQSSGNVFEDLGVRMDVKDELKNAIARAISDLILERGLTQKDAALILKTDQSRISDITRGRLAGYSVDRLVNYLTALGYNVDIYLNKAGHDQGRVIVHNEKMMATG